MIRRDWKDDWVLFGQPEHARISGVLAEAWGAGDFGRPEPWDDVLRATFEHDVGWWDWEEAPTRNTDRQPAHFTETPVDVNFDIFRKGVNIVYSRGYPYSAALVSRHAGNVYIGILRGAGARIKSPDEQDKIRAYVAEQEERQAGLCREINERAEEGTEEGVTMDNVHRNGRFVTTMDTLSLVLCNGWTHRTRLEEVPVGPSGGEGFAELALELADPYSLRVSPWPFSRDSVEATARGRRIPRESFDSDEDLHAALREASPFEMTFRLTPTE